MNTILMALIIEGVAIVAMLVVIVWLVCAQVKLKQEHQVIKEIVQSNSNDISGLCAAALAVDSKIAATDQNINGLATELVAKIAEVGQNEQSSHPYSVDIRKVRSGASVDELMRNSGLSHDEAALLIRLHGSKSQP
jgi:hypothetical protein